LTQTDPKLLKRYMEPEGWAAFIAYHKQRGNSILPNGGIPENALVEAF
jgi:hypothetical protein